MMVFYLLVAGGRQIYLRGNAAVPALDLGLLSRELPQREESSRELPLHYSWFLKLSVERF